MDAINEKGLVAAAVLLWAIRGDENPGHSLPEDQIIKLEKYFVARYGAHHVVWIPGGDADYSGANGEKWKRIGRAVFGEASARRWYFIRAACSGRGMLSRTRSGWMF